MKYIYFGSSGFSRIVLEGLCREVGKPELVVSKPDKPKGRGLKVLATSVSLFAVDCKIPLGKPAALKKKEFIDSLGQLKADLFIVVDYGNIIPKEVLGLPHKFALALHPSLLPKYRGPAPIEYTLLEGNNQTGLTVFKVSQKIDAGDIILQKKITIDDDDDYYSLSQRLAKESVTILVEAVSRVESGNFKLIKQDEAMASETAKFSKKDGLIDWSDAAKDIRNLMRAIVGWPSAYTYYKGMMLKLIKAEAIAAENKMLPGRILAVSQQGISVTTGQGILRITKLQPEGKKIMDAWAFACGHKLSPGDELKSSQQL